MRQLAVVIGLALVAVGCGDDTGGDAAPDVVELSTSTTTPSSTSTSTSSTTTTPASVPADPCADASPFATEADLDGDELVDLVDAGWLCLGTGEVYRWDDPFDVPGDRVAWGSDVDADGIDEVLVFSHSEPPVVARVHEFDPSTPAGLVPLLDDGAPVELTFSHYTGPAGPGGESWFGCTDLDGGGAERLAVGSFRFDAATEETTWTLQPVTWGDDVGVAWGEPVTGSFPAWEQDPEALMPGRRFCKVDELSRQVAEGCSAEGLEPPSAPPGLPAAVAATFTSIVEAAVACDFRELDRIAGDEITLSFGGHNDVAAFLAWGEYGDDQELLRILVELLRMEPAHSDRDPNFWAWPTFWGTDRDPTPEERAQIEAVYGRPWDDLVTELGYLDHRIGIHADGTWLFFVAGD